MEELDLEIQNEQNVEQYMTPDQKAAFQQQQAAAQQPPPEAPPAEPAPPPGSQIQPLANDEDTDQTPATDDKATRLRQALADVQHYQKMKNRSMQDEARYKSAVQTIAKNK
jgi:hypothetical protein